MIKTVIKIWDWILVRDELKMIVIKYSHSQKLIKSQAGALVKKEMDLKSQALEIDSLKRSIVRASDNIVEERLKSKEESSRLNSTIALLRLKINIRKPD